MKRKPSRRPRRTPLKLYVERLETRRLMSAGDGRPQVDYSVAAFQRSLESRLESRTDADSFAWTLAHRPGLADEMGLGALSKALRRHAGFASQHGWGASLARELAAHPRYAAAHHLTTFARPTPPATTTTKTTTTTITAHAAASVAPSSPSPVSPPLSLSDPLTVAVGGTLDVTLSNFGLGSAGLTDIITPQPLPANMTFNRGTGELAFAPAPGQAGTYNFSVDVSNGTRSGTITLPITVTNPAVPSTEVSGQVVDENGAPLANMPVTLGGVSAVTDSAGDFTLTGVPANPGPLSAGGSVGTAQGRLDLTAPVPQLLGHALYMGVKNAIPKPLIVPMVDWSAAAGFNQATAAQPLDIITPALPGFDIHVPASTAAGAVASSGTVSVAQLSAALSAQHMPPGISSGMLLYQVSGAALSGPVQLTLPNSSGFAPGATLNLYALNPLTGGHDIVGLMVVSADGKTMTSMGPVPLNAATTTAASAGAGAGPQNLEPDYNENDTTGCFLVGPGGATGQPNTMCDGCQVTGGNLGNPPNKSAGGKGNEKEDLAMTAGGGSGSSGSSGGSSGSSGSSGSGGYSGSSSGGYSGSGSSGYSGSGPGMELDSNAGLVTGEYFLNHQLVTYQAQGQSIGINLQYSSAQADPTPAPQYQFTTPIGGDSSNISSINAQISLGGVTQGDPTTYSTPDGLSDSETYNVPLQVDASALPTGVYSYSMTETENFGTGANMISITSTDTGNVNVVNTTADPLGAGWSIDGLQQLAQTATDGPVILTAGQQGTEQFDPAYVDGPTEYQDLAVVDGTQSAQVLANDGTGTFPAPSLAHLPFMPPPGSQDVASIASATGDFNGDGKTDLAVVGTSSLSILLNNGSGGFSDGSVYTLPSGYRARGIVAGNFTGHTNGVLDLAVLMSSTSTDAYEIVEYTGNGNGTFATPVVTAVSHGTASITAADSIVAADFNGDGKTDLAFATDDGLAIVMLATSGGSFGTAASLALPSGHDAVGVAVISDIGNSYNDLVVEAANTNLSDAAGPFACLDLFSNNGSGAFSFTSTDQTPGHVLASVTGLVTGDFQGATIGPEIALPIAGDYVGYSGAATDLDVVSISSSATWGNAELYPLSPHAVQDVGGDIVALDLNGSGKPSIALTVDNDNNTEVAVFLADPDSDQLLPEEALLSTASDDPFYLLAAAPFMGTAAPLAYYGPTSDPSTLVQNSNGTWTRSYPDGTLIQFNSAGQETSESDRNDNTFTYAYNTSGPATGALASITDPVELVTTLTYNSSGKISTIEDPADRVTTFTVDSSGDLTKIVDPDGAVTQYAYNSSHEADSETNPDDQTATAHYNSFGQLTSETLFGGTATTSIDAAQSNGLLAPGDGGSLSTSYGGSVTDPDGDTTSVGFNWMSHPTSETGANGGTTSTVYSSQGFPVAVTDAMGRTVTYTYDQYGDVTSITQPYAGGFGEPGETGGTETIAYNDAYGVPTEITDFNGNTTTFVLDSHGNVLEEEQPGGVDQHWTYNSAGQPLTYTDANGHTTTYVYNSLGRLTTVTEPGTGSPTIHYGYDSAGDVTSITDPTGDIVTYTYNEAGRVLTEQNPVQAAAGKETVNTYDAAGNLQTTTDANGHTTTYGYDARNELTTVTDPMDRVTTYGHDAEGNLTSVTDPLNQTTSYTYTPDNEIATITDPTGGTTTDSYNLDDELISVTDPNGFSATYSYNAQDELQGTSEDEKVGFETEEVPVATYTYDNDHNLLTGSDGDDRVTSMVYNALDEETSVTNGDNDTDHYTYDDDGNVLTVSDGLNHVTTYTYDDLGRVLTETDPAGGGTTTMAYDAAGDLLSVEDPDDNITSYAYNAAHEMVTETSPTGGLTTYTYDLVFNVTKSVDPDGHTIDYGYNADNEETSETWVNPSGGSYDVFDYTYNADGELTAVSDDNSSYQYTYNADGEVTSFSDAGTTGLPSVTLDYTYDKDGNRASMSDSLGGVVSYTYDERDELTNETFSGTGLSPEAVANLYDNAGNMTSQTRYSNLAETTEVAATSYTYDDAEQMTGITDKNSSGTTLVSYAYTYDAAGRVTQEVRDWASGASTDTLSYTYTNNNQLTGVTHTNDSFSNESFTWDANGNETGTGYTTSTNNEQTASPGYTYTYDADGNMITAKDTSTSDTWTYTYDFRNRMTGAVEKTSGGTVLAQVTYTYDALDNRIGMDENGTQTWTLYDGSTPVMDFNSSGSLTMRYLNGPAGDIVDAVLARESACGTIAWYLPDRLGTIRDLINNSGAIIDHVDYSAFGTVLDESSPSNGDRLMGFAGMERDTVTGLNLAVRRVENPGTGRWTSQDPTGFTAGDTNLDRYVGNGPINSSDSSGLSDSWVPGYITVGPSFSGPTGALYIPENEKKGRQPLPKAGTTTNADALILPCVGLFKVRAGGRIRLGSYDPKTGTYIVTVTNGWDGPTLFYPRNGWNPFGRGYGDVPGTDVNEGGLPRPGSRYPFGGQELATGTWIIERGEVEDPSDAVGDGIWMMWKGRNGRYCTIRLSQPEPPSRGPGGISVSPGSGAYTSSGGNTNPGYGGGSAP